MNSYGAQRNLNDLHVLSRADIIRCPGPTVDIIQSSNAVAELGKQIGNNFSNKFRTPQSIV